MKNTVERLNPVKIDHTAMSGSILDENMETKLPNTDTVNVVLHKS